MTAIVRHAVRQATPEDTGAISRLVMVHARRGDVLPRSLQSIRETIDNWVVIEAGGQVVACGSLLDYGPRLAEVRSLAVADAAKGRGYGRAVTQALIERGRAKQLHTLFALTRVAPFFERLGFEVTVKDRFPDKVWRDCNQCPIMEHCDEIAVVYEFMAENLP